MKSYFFLIFRILIFSWYIFTMNKYYKQDCLSLIKWIGCVLVLPLIIVLTEGSRESYQRHILQLSEKSLESQNFKISQMRLKRLNPDLFPCFIIKHYNSNTLNDYEVWFSATKDNKIIQGYVCGWGFFYFRKIMINEGAKS